MRVIRLVLIIILTLLILLVGGTLYLALAVDGLDTSFPNLTLSGIPVGGLTKDGVSEALNARGWQEYISKPLTVRTLAGQQFTVDTQRTGLQASAEEMAELVWAYGRSGDVLENAFTYLRCLLHPVSVEADPRSADMDYIRSCISQHEADLSALLGDAEYVPDYEAGRLVLRKGWGQLHLDKDALAEEICDAIRAGKTELQFDRLMSPLTRPDFQTIHTELQKEPRDASFTDDGRFEVIDEVVGCAFDVSLAEQLWDSAAPAEEISVPMDVTWPSVTGQELRDTLFRDLLGACTTNYMNSTDNRCSNVQLASSKINGTILYPGETFSYNTVVGQRTTEAGFLPAPAYVDGDVKDEIGGGACQVSSTLYAATLFAFMETVQRENHYFPVHYMQLGTDATVTIPDEGGRAIDFVFRNNKHYPIKIVAYCDTEARDLTFEIWGTLEDSDYMPVEFDNSWSWQFTYDRTIAPAYPDRPGYKIKLETEKYYFSDEIGEGTRTLTHRVVYDQNGTAVLDELTNALLPNGNPAMDTYYDHNG